MRFAMTAAFAVACLAVPAQAAPIMLGFTINATGNRLTYVPCTVGGVPGACPNTSAINPTFTFNQAFDFTGGVSVFQSGIYWIGDGQVNFTLRDLGSNAFQVENFTYAKGPLGPFPNGIPAGAVFENATAPTQIIASVPEPATWAMMLVGFGAVGGALRNRRTRVRFA